MTIPCRLGGLAAAIEVLDGAPLVLRDVLGYETVIADPVPGGWAARVGEWQVQDVASIVYAALYRAGAVRYSGRRDALDRPVWEST